MALSPTRLRSARQAAGLTRTELAAAINRGEQTVVSYELGRVQPPLATLDSLAAALSVRPGDLLEEAPADA